MSVQVETIFRNASELLPQGKREQRIAGSNRDVLFAAYRVVYRPTFYSPGQEHLQEKVARTVI
jgi:hypothetical protein